jgi:ADP-ribose pyrophosphatase YjhB (NUDIX family)
MCYTITVQNSFYASGFLYSIKTHQILLLKSPQKNDLASSWSMLGGEGKGGEEAEVTFQRIISKLLNINLKKERIYPVYDYFHNTRNKINHVFYAEVGKTKTFNSSKVGIFSWVSFRETLKLPFTSQTKQDIVVGERVINAKWRDDEAKKT